MAAFKRLTVEEARTLSRDELLPRVEAEQHHWDRLISRGQIRVGEDEAYKTFLRITHVVIDPMARDERHDPDFWTKPLGELGEL
ncbi:hypothetical protein GCM10023194_48930 [Planotetraspora phitsanulokensis]|uniref:Uncharacterized protein n=1 Tax=Planotetraspora phitsanulokensis TaxID=575192 RepID=A0A8J3UB38_9ACTN|nr:hypothetical protein [Planotetraspora phitsanulokensis]GII42118.1 hypothetical protein Pph01_71210 [Planotetraspora phitsanulokensis]